MARKVEEKDKGKQAGIKVKIMSKQRGKVRELYVGQETEEGMGCTYGGILLSSSNEQNLNRCPTGEGEKYHNAEKGGSELKLVRVSKKRRDFIFQ